ncbi:MAG: hypothetical protein AAF558_08195, partial [Verrucomicrobiota bacterium]
MLRLNKRERQLLFIFAGLIGLAGLAFAINSLWRWQIAAKSQLARESSRLIEAEAWLNQASFWKEHQTW